MKLWLWRIWKCWRLHRFTMRDHQRQEMNRAYFILLVCRSIPPKLESTVVWNMIRNYQAKLWTRCRELTGHFNRWEAYQKQSHSANHIKSSWQHRLSWEKSLCRFTYILPNDHFPEPVHAFSQLYRHIIILFFKTSSWKSHDLAAEMNVSILLLD